MDLSRAEIEFALQNMTIDQKARVKVMARRYADGLASMSPEDLIQEVFTQLLAGNRRFPCDVDTATVVINAIHSEASKFREREKGAINHTVSVAAIESTDETQEDGPQIEPRDDRTPERILSGQQTMASIEERVADDTDLQDLVAAWALGMRGNLGAEYLGWDMNRYEAARKRLIRRLDEIGGEV